MGSRLAPTPDLLLRRCVDICRSYRLDRVVAANLRACLAELSVPREELDLFAMVLARHVRAPADARLEMAAQALWRRLLEMDADGGGRTAAAPALSPSCAAPCTH